MSNLSIHSPPDLAAMVVMALQRIELQDKRIAELEVLAGLKVRPKCDGHQRRRRYTPDDLARLAGELGILARSNGGAMPSDAVVAKSLGVERATFNQWKNSDDHPVGRAYRVFAGVGPMNVDRPAISRRRDRIERDRYRQRADDD